LARLRGSQDPQLPPELRTGKDLLDLSGDCPADLQRPPEDLDAVAPLDVQLAGEVGVVRADDERRDVRGLDLDAQSNAPGDRDDLRRASFLGPVRARFTHETSPFRSDGVPLEDAGEVSAARLGT
jgi:hypothetical protein